MRLCIPVVVIASVLSFGCATPAARTPTEDLQRQVEQTERAFAKTMADRNHAAFASYLSDETVFFNGNRALRGKAAVTAAWAPLFKTEWAPFSWEPDQVQVLDSGTLALSTGPVRDSSGKIIARFNSIWRQESPGVWRIVFDRGSPVCDDGGQPDT